MNQKKYCKKKIRLNRFQDRYKTFEEYPRRRGVFRAHASINDGAFL